MPALRRPAHGEVHAGVIVAGLVVAVGLAWWFAQGESSRAAPTATDGGTVQAPAATNATTAAKTEQTPAGVDAAGKPLYRWIDAAGVVHFTDVAPADRPYSQVDIDPERNVVESPVTPEP